MGRRRTPPQLRVKRTKAGPYWVADVRRPDDSRTTLSFGPVDEDRAAETYATFSEWLKLFQANPHKTLSYPTPGHAVAQMTDARAIISMADLVRAYEDWAQTEFGTTRTGRESPNFRRLQFANQLIIERFAGWPVESFGQDELRAIRDALVEYRYTRGKSEKGLTRNSINLTIQELRRMLSWAVAREIMKPGQERLLREIKKIKAGTPNVRDGDKRRPVTPAEFQAVVANVNPTIADMMKVMWLVPIRPDEVCRMRPCDFLRDQETWLYIPGRDTAPTGDHKTAGHGHIRAIPMTTQIQKILKPRISKAESDKSYLFDPAVATQKLAANKWREKAQGHKAPEHPMVKPGKRYKPTSFSNAIKRGCKRAKVDAFTAYDLRRTTATRVDALLGTDAAQRLLGHANRGATDPYLLEPVKRSIEAAQQLEAAAAKLASDAKARPQ